MAWTDGDGQVGRMDDATAWMAWLGRMDKSLFPNFVVLVVVGEAHWIGSVNIMGWGWGWV